MLDEMAEARPDPFFLAGAPGLDFLNSIATPVDVPVEWIASGADLLDWLDKAGLVPTSALEEIGANALPGELDAIAAQARALREWFRGLVICGEDFPNIRACDGHNCALYFTDRTRGRMRRWCSMAVCGNRAKQAAHRLRK